MSAPVSKNHGSRPAAPLPAAAKRPGALATPGGQAAVVPAPLPVRVPVTDERFGVQMVWAIHNQDWADLLAGGGSIRIYAVEGE